MSAHGPESWDDADWAAFDARAGRAVMMSWITDPEGVPPGVEGNPFPSPALHYNTVFRKMRSDTSLIPDIEAGDLTEAELDQRVALLVQRISALPAAIRADIKNAL